MRFQPDSRPLSKAAKARPFLSTQSGGTGGGYALVTLCIGRGQGLAVIVERV